MISGGRKGQPLIIDYGYFCPDLRKRTGADASCNEPERDMPQVEHLDKGLSQEILNDIIKRVILWE